LIDETPSHDGKYIAVFHKHATEDTRLEVAARINAKRKRSEDDLTHHNVHQFNAISGSFDSESLQELLKEESIDYVQPNMRYHLTGACQKARAVWHLERINTHQRPPRYSGVYSFSEDAANVDAYIMDSGIEVNHPEFEGRARWGINTIDREQSDCNGHGTHVAGTVGSKTYGVAKKVKLISVKAMNCEGAGNSLTMLKGHEFIAKEYQKNTPRRPSVVNMSVGSPYDRAHNDIVRNAIKLGLTYVIAAGNEYQDACGTSPSSVQEGITVGATDINDNFAEFSNWGQCVHILAPGEEITSTWPGKTVNTISGTSMAAPHVAGAAALYLAKNPTASPAAVRQGLLKDSSAGLVKKVVMRTPNQLLFSAC